MSLFRVWQEVPVMATHSAQTYRQSRSVRTRSETAFTTLVSAFLLFSGPDCHNRSTLLRDENESNSENYGLSPSQLPEFLTGLSGPLSDQPADRRHDRRVLQI